MYFLKSFIGQAIRWLGSASIPAGWGLWRQCRAVLVFQVVNVLTWPESDDKYCQTERDWELARTREQLFTVDVVPPALWPSTWAGAKTGAGGNINLSDTILTWYECHTATVQPPLPPSPHTENTWKTQSRRWKCVYFFIGQIWSLQHTGLTGQSLPVSAVRCQKSFKFYLFCSIPGSGWWRLEEFLHEDLKIGGCKIKRYFKMCLPVFIGSIKASFGSAFWPPWSGGHFYNQPSKHDELSELETNFVVAGVGRDLAADIRYLI